MVLRALSQKVSQMPHHNGTHLGSLKGLRLPPKAWYVLRRENIRTITQLRAIAGRIERFEGIGPKTAQAIRDEVARVTFHEGQHHDESQSPSPWIA